MMECSDHIDVLIMKIASKYIKQNWRMVFRNLGLSDPEINQVIKQYFHISMRKVIYQLLLCWKSNDDDPSLGELCTILWKNKNFKCFDKLKILFKERRSQAQIAQTPETTEALTNGNKLVITQNPNKKCMLIFKF